MASTESFDITTGCDLQEVDNAVNQAQKELGQRYDFRNLKFEIDFDRPNATLKLSAPDSFVLDAIFDVLQAKLLKRGVPVKNFKRGEQEQAAGNSVRQVITLKQEIDTETGKRIVKFIKDAKLKKVQGSIQKDQVRVSSPSRDDLQQMMAKLRQEDFGIELTFGNYR